MSADWKKLKAEYARGAGYRELADRCGLSLSYLRHVGAREGWGRARAEYRRGEGTPEEEIAAIRARLDLRLFRMLESRVAEEQVEGTELRRLVQSYLNMCSAREPLAHQGQEEGHGRLMEAIREAWDED